MEQKGNLVQYLHSIVKWETMGIIHGHAAGKQQSWDMNSESFGHSIQSSCQHVMLSLFCFFVVVVVL